MPDPAQPQVKRKDWTLAYVVAFAVGLVGLIAIVTAPVRDLLGDSAYAVPASLHGISSIIYVIVATVLAYFGYKMYVDKFDSYHDLRILAALAAFFSLVTIIFGNWIYIAYRWPGGPRTYFLENSGAVHEVFFEFKEFIALFTLPLSVAAAFIVWQEKDALRDRPDLRRLVAVLLVLSWLCLMLAFALGAAITKLRSV